MLLYPAMTQPTRARIEQVSPDDEAATKGSAKFPPVPLQMARNYCIMDMHYESVPWNNATFAPSSETPAEFVGSFNGLAAVSDDIKNLLPPDCRTAFDKALAAESEFQSRWGSEGEKMSRRNPIIDKAIVPYSMS
jgi:chromatin structure-remodeling complex protein RSC7